MKIIARKEDLESLVGFGEGTARRLEKRGEFPKRRKIADGSVGWLVSELVAWADARPVATSGMRGEATRLRREREKAA